MADEAPARPHLPAPDCGRDDSRRTDDSGAIPNPGAHRPAAAGESAVALQCCHCGAVRGPGGSWPDRSVPPGALVSHGICPACLARHYPGVRAPSAVCPPETPRESAGGAAGWADARAADRPPAIGPISDRPRDPPAAVTTAADQARLGAELDQTWVRDLLDLLWHGTAGPNPPRRPLIPPDDVLALYSRSADLVQMSRRLIAWSWELRKRRTGRWWPGAPDSRGSVGAAPARPD